MRGEIADTTFNNKFIFPFIAHIRISYMSDSLLDHYVVVANITTKKIIIWDPDFSKRKYAVNRQDFLKIWTGYVLFLSPQAGYIPRNKQRNAILKFLPLLLPHKRELIITCLASALLIIFGIVISYYYKYIIDEVVISKAAFTLMAFSVGALVITLVQSIVEALRGVLISYIAYKADVQLSLSYITHTLRLPLSFFDTRKPGEIVSRLTDISIIRRALSGTLLSLALDCVLIVIIGQSCLKSTDCYLE